MFKSFAARLSIVFFSLSALVLIILFSFFYFRATQIRDQAFEKYIGNLTELSARMIRGEEVQAVPLTEGCEKLPQTQALIQKLQAFQSIDSNFFDAYLMVRDEDPAFLRFVTNADRERTPVGCGERYSVKDDPEILRGFEAPFVSLSVFTDKWGSWVGAYAPVKTVSGEVVALLGMDVAQETLKHIQSSFLERFIVAIVVCLIFSLGLGLLSSIWLVKPIRRVVKSMEIVAGGNLDHKLEHFSQTEFNRIAGIFNKMTGSLKRMMYELEINVRLNARVKRELEIATEIQQAIFPAFPPKVEGLEIEAKSVPAEEVGGDYFDFLPVGNKGKMGFMIADAAGKGLPGTLYMTRSRSIFQVISSQQKEPGETLSRSNDYIAADASSRKGMFITALYVLYDNEKKQMTYSNAGHYHPLWFKSAEKAFARLTSGGVPVGIASEQEYPQETIQLSSNDLVIMYTDGLIEAKKTNGEMFGIDRLKRVVEQNSALSAHDLFEKIEASVHEFIEKAPAFDDMTLIVIRVL